MSGTIVRAVTDPANPESELMGRWLHASRSHLTIDDLLAISVLLRCRVALSCQRIAAAASSAAPPERRALNGLGAPRKSGSS
jgi:hypothetical protein